MALHYTSLDAPLRWEDWKRFRRIRRESMSLGERIQPYVAGIYILVFIVAANVLLRFATLENKE